MLDLSRLTPAALRTHPFTWAEIGNLYSAEDAAALAASFPHDHFKTVSGYGGEKNYDYEARALLGMGTDTIAFAQELSEAWLRLAQDLGSAGYREAMSELTGIDLRSVPMEVNVFHYGPGASLGAHPDLPDKLVTHILYFNESWDRNDGGCLNILHRNDPTAVAAEIEPLVGNSAILVRSDNSWHAVTPVVRGCHSSRRSLTATFYRPGSVSSLWPPGDGTALHEYPRA
ncbi:2OG-Fe(II) oxygenase [Pseudomonas sp. SWRI92]|uniref:2OG-Fe(II) oxygenase n=1 Tax=Pseudomonas marvdashtae TaxID=2745500 RepID=A0A923FN44_9PSED|nr:MULTISPECIES: 2OG-Fe(II) oxygenase [Pseudomonas]MBC3372415.1 2OG-Fe(II) oxygenase [Pseudomonas sp. SWRI92]MBV4551560.1 2OG-Fe(II) oxygenase [Pseudomonas marvdashtae]